MRLPPQKWFPSACNETIHGQLCGTASTPPTTRTLTLGGIAGTPQVPPANKQQAGDFWWPWNSQLLGMELVYSPGDVTGISEYKRTNGGDSDNHYFYNSYRRHAGGILYSITSQTCLRLQTIVCVVLHTRRNTRSVNNHNNNNNNSWVLLSTCLNDFNSLNFRRPPVF